MIDRYTKVYEGMPMYRIVGQRHGGTVERWRTRLHRSEQGGTVAHQVAQLHDNRPGGIMAHQVARWYNVVTVSYQVSRRHSCGMLVAGNTVGWCGGLQAVMVV